MYGYKTGFKAQASSNIPFVQLKSYVKADPGYARVGVSVTHRGDSIRNPVAVMTALAGLFDNKATPVVGSWVSINKHDLFEDLVGVISGNKQIMPYDERNTNFRAVSGNMFMDNERNMWVLKETDGGKLWVRTSAYDDERVLDDLMASMSSNHINHMGYNGDTCVDVNFRQNVEGGTYVTYVSKSSDSVCSGFVASTVVGDNKVMDDVIVIGREAQNYEVVGRNMLLSICSSDDFDKVTAEPEMTATAANSMRSNVSLEDIISYYKTLFSRNAAYFKMFEDRLRSHFYG